MLTMATQVGADALGVALDAMAFQAGDTRPAQQLAPRSARPARRWSAPPCTPPATRAAATSSSSWRSATTASPLHGAERRGRRPSRAARMTSTRAARRRRDLRRAARAQPHGRRRGDGLLAPAAARHAARPAHLRRAVRRGRRRPRARARPRPAAGRGRSRPGGCSTPCSPAASSWAGCSGASARRCSRATAWIARHGRWAASNLAEYLVPVNADAPDVDGRVRRGRTTTCVGPLGAKGVGEIGQVGAAAAIANAVFHATGRRIRELPMAPELVMDPVTPALTPRAARAAAEPTRRSASARARLLGASRSCRRLLRGRARAAPERSLLVLGPLVTFSLPLVAMVAFWWDDWPGTQAAPQLVGLGRHGADRRRRGRASPALGQIVVGRLDLRGDLRPSPGAGHVPTFPATMPLAGRGVHRDARAHARRRGLAAARARAVPARPAWRVAAAWAVALVVYLALGRRARGRARHGADPHRRLADALLRRVARLAVLARRDAMAAADLRARSRHRGGRLTFLVSTVSWGSARSRSPPTPAASSRPRCCSACCSRAGSAAASR